MRTLVRAYQAAMEMSVQGLDGVWASLPASDFAAFVVAVIIMQRFKLQHHEHQASSTTK